MKTFEELKQTVKTSEENLIFIENQKIQNPTTSEFNRIVSSHVINDCQSRINHLDEETIIEIGLHANHIISIMQQMYRYDSELYYKYFEEFLKKYIVSTPSAIILGVESSDLAYFKNVNPTNKEACERFIQIVNANFDTKVPTQEQTKKIEEEFKQSRYSDDEERKEKAYLNFKEMQRDSGKIFYLNGNFKPLWEDQEYQKIKNKYSGLSL